MRSAKLINGKIEIIDLAKPKLEDNEEGAIIKVLGCGLCGSDLVKIKHSAPQTENKLVLGHEVVGIIEKINSTTSFKAGDVVALGHHYPCGNCEFCKNGSVSMCKTFKNTNISPCGFSEFIKVTEGHLKNTVYKMSDKLKDDEKAFLEPLSCVIRAIRRAGFNYNDKNNSNFSALVAGLGSIGLLTLKALKAFGVAAYGIDISKERADLAFQHGFSYIKNKKYDVIFLTAGAKSAINTALENVIDGGKIIVFSSIQDDNFGIANNTIYYRELSIIASYSPAPSDLKLSGELLNQKIVNVEGLSVSYSLDNLAQAVDDSFKNKVFKAYIKI